MVRLPRLGGPISPELERSTNHTVRPERLIATGSLRFRQDGAYTRARGRHSSSDSDTAIYEIPELYAQPSFVFLVLDWAVT
mmetsp:Transcript_25993/g.44718  ORF Transcript_25993/g.44718 Transcript_25993/m.44718 type:complete len:81 (+) Transcript_25993:375-617(+)